MSPIIIQVDDNAHKLSLSYLYEVTVISQDIDFIDFDIRNNSLRLNSFYVKGPNGKGGNFSYGFKMLPFENRVENWPVGTIVYEQSYAGKLKELIVIKKDFEGNIVDLYD